MYRDKFLRPTFPGPRNSVSRGDATFRGLGAARGLEGVTTQEKEGIALKNGAQKLVSFGEFQQRRRGVAMLVCQHGSPILLLSSTKTLHT